MKGYYRLLNTELQSMLWGLLLLCGLGIGIQLLLLQLTVSSMSRETALMRFEELYASSGSVVAFAMLLILLMGLFALNLYGNYWGSKSIYTLLTLPLRATAVYWSKLTAYAVALMLFVVSYVLGMRLGYSLVQGAIQRYSSEDWTLAGGWLMAVIRSSFLRLLLPMTWEGILSSVSLALVLLSGLFYVLLCERSRRFGGLPLLLPALFFFVREIRVRTADPIYGEIGFSQLYLGSLVLLGLAVLFIVLGSRLVRRRAIA